MILRLDKKLHLNKDAIESPNLTDRFSDEDLSSIGERVWTGYSVDRASRANWMRRNNAGMNLAMQIAKDKSYPWPNCSNIIFPLITIAAVNFSTKSYGNLVQGVDVVQYRTFGTDENEKARAIRIGKHMSWQVLEEDKGWEDQHDKLLINLAVVGTNFIKTRMDASLGHNVAELVMAKDLVINYWAASVEKALRRTHIIPLTRNDIYERVQEKTYADCLEEAWYNSLPVLATDEGAEADHRSGLTPPPPDEDTPFRGLEQHCRLDLDGDGYAEPYIVTIEEGSQKVLKIACRFEREEAIERVRDSSTGKVQRIHATEYFTKYTFIPSPDGGIYDVGFRLFAGAA
jgi:chaperonin GroES